MTQDQLTKTIPSDMDGNPPLYIAKNRNGDIYVNNARIIPSLSVEMINNEGKRQVCTQKDFKRNNCKKVHLNIF